MSQFYKSTLTAAAEWGREEGMRGRGPAAFLRVTRAFAPAAAAAGPIGTGASSSGMRLHVCVCVCVSVSVCVCECVCESVSVPRLHITV
jgi:hypothetical protein